MDLNMEPPIDYEAQIEEEIIAELDQNMHLPLDHDTGFDLNMEAPHDGLDLNLPLEDDNHIGDQGGIDLNLEPPVAATCTRKVLVLDEDRRRIYQTLLARSTNGKLKKHVTKEVVEQSGVHIRTVQRIWNQVTFERAKRRSVNRLAWTMEVKPIASITRDVIREFMTDKVLPAIRAKWPREDVNKSIYIQQDNAPSHIELDDPQFLEAAKQDGFDIRYYHYN
ncbi:hypothetical protein E2562_017562 [Oryza meyeriana var. granulata]|uniref:DUF7769 domain-containing protein n=1 Tax=Oryza meyeriana var. granulata TaxID=110450 RepID=A0A6G1C6Q3_9ORYZ|nr:hypothetical protein E2562_017562 [Oryza meyeriana var. granulata]